MSGLLSNQQIRALADEDSVRGVMVRKALEEAEGMDGDDLRRLEQALKLLLGRFQAMEGISA